MAVNQELAKLVVRLTGDSKQYVKTLEDMERRTAQWKTNTAGQLINAKGQFVSMADAFEGRAADIIRSIERVGRAFKKVGGFVKRLGRNMASLGRSMSLRVTAPLIAMGGFAAKSFATYERSISKVTGLVGISAEETKKLDLAIRQIGPAVGKGPAELADAMFFITSAGLRGQQAIDALNVSAKAAAAGLGETSSVADAVTSAMNAYGAEVLNAEKATDILTAAVREGKLEAGSLAPVLGRLLPSASAMSIEFEQVAGALAVMSRTGLSAAEASTSLQSIMSTLLKPTTEAAKVLDAAGLSMAQLREVAAGPNGLIEVMRILNDRFSDDQLAQIVPNVRALRGVMNVLAQDASIVDGVMQGVANSAGATQAAFDEAAKTLSFTWDQAWSQMQFAMVSFGEAVAPIFSKLSMMINDVAQWLNSLSEEQKRSVAKWAAIAAAAGPFLIILGSILGPIGSLIAQFGILANLQKAYGAATGIAKAATIGLHGALVALATVAFIMAAKAAVDFVQKLTGIRAEIDKIVKETKKWQQDQDKSFGKKMSLIGIEDPAAQQKQLKEMEKDLKKSLDNRTVLLEKLRARWVETRSDFKSAGSREKQFTEMAQVAAEIKKQKEHLEKVGDQIEMNTALMDKQKRDAEKAAQDASPAVEAAGIDPKVEKAMKKKIEALLKSLGKDVALFEFDETTMKDVKRQLADLEHELAQAGMELTDEQKEQLKILRDELAALNKVKDEYDKILEKAKELSAKEIQAMVNRGELKQKDADPLIKKKEEDAKKKAADAAKKVIEGSMTPLQKFKKEVLEIKALVDSGALTKEQAQAAVTKKAKELAKEKKEKPDLNFTRADTFAGAQQRAEIKKQQEAAKQRQKLIDEAKKTADNTWAIANSSNSNSEPANI